MLRRSFGEEKRSGTAIKGRDQLQTILDFTHAGDVLVVTKLDRLARSVADLSRIVDLLAEKGASLRVLNANIDTKTASGKAFLGMLGVFAEFETNLRRERQLRPNRPGSTKADRLPSIPPKWRASRLKVSAPQRSPERWVSAEPRSTACLDSRLPRRPALAPAAQPRCVLSANQAMLVQRIGLS
jgi:hypothetical protein